MLIGFTHESVLVVLGEWLETDYDLTLLALGGVGTLLGLADLAGEGVMIAITDRIGKRRAMIGGATVAVVGLTALAGIESFVPAMAALAVTMAGIEFGYISGIPLATELRPEDRTRVLGWFYLSTGSGRIVGDLVAPGLFTSGGMSLVAVTAAGTLVAAIILLVARKSAVPVSS